MSIKRRINQLEKIAGRQGGLTPEQMAERCRYIEERLFGVGESANGETANGESANGESANGETANTGVGLLMLSGNNHYRTGSPHF